MLLNSPRGALVTPVSDARQRCGVWARQSQFQCRRRRVLPEQTWPGFLHFLFPLCHAGAHSAPVGRVLHVRSATPLSVRGMCSGRRTAPFLREARFASATSLRSQTAPSRRSTSGSRKTPVRKREPATGTRHRSIKPSGVCLLKSVKKKRLSERVRRRLVLYRLTFFSLVHL